jgi:beta-N-acetylhexosaminidase
MSSGGLEPADAATACLFPGFDGLAVPDWLRRWLAKGLGGVVLFARNVRDPDQVAALCTELRAERPNLLVAADEEGGDVTRLEAATGSSFPGNLALGAVDDVALTRRVAAAIAGELAAAGIDLDLAPVADVVVDSANPIVGVRSFGSDPLLVARHAAAFVEGMQSRGVAACAKHFPGHGETSADSHLELPVADADRVTLLARALPPFHAAVEAGVRAVMTAHIRFPALGGDPATLSPEVIGLLRDELGFGGLVITDALEMRAISGTVGLDEGAVGALAAGADALCLGADRTPDEVERIHRAIVEAALSGRLPADRLHEAAARVAETAAWTDPKPHRDLEAGAEAARRALRVEGDPRTGHGAGALVVECRSQATIAAGESEHGLAELLPEAEVVPVREGDSLPDPAGRRLVLVVRDAHRHPWQRDLFRPEAIVVETGFPAWRPDGTAAYVVSHGAGRANLEALAERLSA